MAVGMHRITGLQTTTVALRYRRRQRLLRVANARSLDRGTRAYYASRTFQHEAGRSRNDS